MRSRLPKLLSRLPTLPRWAPLAVALVLAVCGGAATALLASGGGDAPAPSVAGGSVGSVAAAEARAARGAAARRAQVSVALERMSLPDRVAQLFLFGFDGAGAGPGTPIGETLRERGLGGLVVASENYAGPGQLDGLTAAVRRVAAAEDHVRPLVMAAQEGGPANALAGLPPGTAPAALEDPAAGGAEAARAAPRLLELGIDGVLAPIADVAPPEAPALGPRAYSEDPEQTAEFVRRVVRAYRSAGVVAAPAHFPGLGAAAQPTEAGPAQVVRSEQELAEGDLAPFRAAIRAGAPAMTLSHGLYAADDFVVPGSLSRRIVTGLLRERLDFGGVAITDDLTSPAVVSLYEVPDAALTALRAGADMLQVSGPPETQADAYDSLLSAVVAGRIDRERIDESVRRILSMKQAYGLLEPAARDTRVSSSP